jgi:hypothetical protein
MIPYPVGTAGLLRVDRPRLPADRDAALAAVAPLAVPPSTMFVLVFRDPVDDRLGGAMLVHHEGHATVFYVGSRGPVLSENLLDAMRRVVAVNHPHLHLTPEVARDLGVESGVGGAWSQFDSWPVRHGCSSPTCPYLCLSDEEVEVLRILDEPLPYLASPGTFEEWLRSRTP